MTRNERRELKRYVSERDKALIEGTVEAIVAFARKWRTPFPDTHHVAEIMLHKMRCAVTTIPPDLVNLSKAWLAERGYSPEIRP